MSFDSSCGFLFYHLHGKKWWWLLVYVKKLILIEVCVVEFSGLHSDFFVCKLQFYTVKLFFTVWVITRDAAINQFRD